MQSSAESKQRSVISGKIEWLDIEDPSRAEILALGDRFPFHPLNLEDCLSKRQLTRVEGHESYVFLLLHFPSLGEGKLIVRNQLSLFVGKDYVISLHSSNLKVLGEMAKELAADEGLRSESMKSPAELVYAIIDKSVDGIFPLLDRIRDDLDSIEDEVFEGKVSSAGSINRVRREIADLRSIILPLKRTLTEASALLQQFATRDLSPYFADIIDHIEKAWETLEQTRETIEIYKDSDFILSSEKTNRVLSILTIIFTLSIPASLIGAIYGMNVALPGGNGQNPSTILGPYTSLIVLLLLMLVPAMLMVIYFRRQRWI